MNNLLDFLIIGAQKSATTALFKYLQHHEHIAMPAAKESPLFTQEVTPAEIDTFLETNYRQAKSRIKGKATPQYMCDEKIPARLYEHNPELKLIAVLRDPIERAWSQYRMNLRRETENRSFDDAITESLADEKLELARSGCAPSHQGGYESESDYYLAWSEYGRILDNYRKFFKPEQILIIYTSDLELEPATTLDKVLEFLSLEAGYRPENLGEKVHQGGTSLLISNKIRHRLRNQMLFKSIWDGIPERHKSLIRYWYEQMNVRTSVESPALSAANRKRLEIHFQKDAALIQHITGHSPDWAK